jgi:glutathione S-transferase
VKALGMAIELHWVSGSPYAWRVQLALEVKRLSYVSHLHQLSQLKAPAYLSLNPRGRVPVLVDDGYVLYESLAILAYLERKYPQPALFGERAEMTGLIWRHIAEYTSYADAAVEAFIVPIYFGEAVEKAAQVRGAAAALTSELDAWNGILAQSAYLSGLSLSAADLVLFPAIKSIERAASKPAAKSIGIGLLPIAAHWPYISAWMRRIEALPGYDRTYPPHWKF